jgi:hypothetical protein
MWCTSSSGCTGCGRADGSCYSYLSHLQGLTLACSYGSMISASSSCCIVSGRFDESCEFDCRNASSIESTDEQESIFAGPMQMQIRQKQAQATTELLHGTKASERRWARKRLLLGPPRCPSLPPNRRHSSRRSAAAGALRTLCRPLAFVLCAKMRQSRRSCGHQQHPCSGSNAAALRSTAERAPHRAPPPLPA